MNYTSSTEHENVLKNIKTLEQIWKKRCNVIEGNNKGNYRYHLLFILNDLCEEIENNRPHFFGNSYAKKFFKLQVANYCDFYQQTEKSSKLDKIKRKWAKEVNNELRLIAKALGGGIELEDIPEYIPNWTEYINNIVNRLISDSQFQKTLDILYKQLFEKDLINDQIEFLVDTLIILFNTRGRLQLYFELEKQLETIEECIYNANILENSRDVLGIDSAKQIFLSPQVWNSPLRNAQSPNEYKKEVRSYYSNLTIEKRLNCLKNIYCQDPGNYKIIFHIQGVDFPEKFSIGQVVEFYNSKIHHRYIENNCKRNNWYSENFPPDLDPNDFEIKASFCVAVNIQGIDTKSMVMEARKIAERIIGVILTDKIHKHDIILSNDWIICNSQGEIYNFEIEGTSNIRYNKDNEITSEFNKYDKNRLSIWISSENEYCVTRENEYWVTIKKFFYSIDWYRQSVESSQSSQQILNSWFAMEMFRKDSQELTDPKSFPSPSEKLLKKYNIKETQGCWLSKDIKKLQLILVLSKLKFNLFTRVRGTAIWLMNGDIYSIAAIDKELIDQLSVSNYDNERAWLYKMLEIFPIIEEKLKNEDKELKYLSGINEILYNHQQCEDYFFNEIIELKDDVYNIYRIRNMLVHSGSTNSKLLDYYAKRSLEYCDAILDIIAYKIFQTSSDPEIKPLESYFQEILIEAKNAIEFVKENKMDKFRDWILS